MKLVRQIISTKKKMTNVKKMNICMLEENNKGKKKG